MKKYYFRKIDSRVNKVLKSFPVIFITGARQTGKTTYIQNKFKKYKYFNLESKKDFELISQDPEYFLEQNPKNIVIDEVQRYPEILSAIQVHVDKEQKMGSIILSGSQNLLVSEKVNQSLAGRVAHIVLHPFSYEELVENKIEKKNVWEQILKGGYPAVYSRKINLFEFYNSYLTTFIERDIRLIKNIENLDLFKKFMILLAGRVGQVFNAKSLADDLGISPHTVKNWVNLLEASYVIFKLQPYYSNIGKRLMKSPKIFFYDTGLVAFLLNLDNVNELENHFIRGNIFENFVIAEIKKRLSMESKTSDLYFYRDSNGVEIDLLIDKGLKIDFYEIKSAMNFSQSFLTNIEKVEKVLKNVGDKKIIYGGAESLKLKNAEVVSWKKMKIKF